MKRSHLIILFLLFIFLTGFVVINKIQNPSMKVYRNDQYNFEISYPDFWNISFQHPREEYGNMYLPGIPGNGAVLDHIIFSDYTRLMFKYRPDVSISIITNPNNLAVDEWVSQYKPLTMGDAQLKPIPLAQQELERININGNIGRKMKVVIEGQYTQNTIVVTKGNYVYLISDVRLNDLLPYDLFYRNSIVNKVMSSFE